MNAVDILAAAINKQAESIKDMSGDDVKGLSRKKDVINTAVSNVFNLIEKMGNEEQLKERFYFYIGEHDSLLRVVVKLRNKEYSDMCAKLYDMEA